MTRRQLRHWALWSALTLGLLLTFFSLFYFQAFDLPDSALGRLFLALALPGHFVFLGFLTTLPALVISQILPSRRLTGIMLGLPAIALTVVVTIDINTFELYRFHLNRMVWELFTGGGAGDIFAFSPLDTFLILSLFAGVSVLAVAAVWLARRQVERGRRGRWPALLMLLVMVSGQCLYAWADATYYRPVTRALAVIPWAQPLTAKSFFEKHGIAKPEDQTMRLDRPEEGSFNYPKDDFVCQAEKPKNLLFILVDSLRADVLNPEVMPASSALAQKGWRFDRHYSTANATRFGVFGLFYGIDGSYWFPALAEQRGPALISAMVDNDYHFGLFTSASKVSPEFDRTVYAPIRDRIDLERTPGDSKAERDLAVTRQWRDFIAAQSGDSPFMSLLFYDAPHGYDYPEGFELKFTPQLDNVSYMALDEDTDPEPFFNRYRNSAHFVDQQIAEALAALEQSGMADDTVVVITSDHGQEFNDSGDNTWGHNSSYSPWQTQVPMVIYHPDREARAFDHLSSHIDVPPTLMRDVLGCTPPLNSYTQGHYLDSGKDHELLTFTSWSRSALFDGEKTTVFMPHDDPVVFDANYREMEGEPANAADIVKAMELRSEFLR